MSKWNSIKAATKNSNNLKERATKAIELMNLGGIDAQAFDDGSGLMILDEVARDRWVIVIDGDDLELAKNPSGVDITKGAWETVSGKDRDRKAMQIVFRGIVDARMELVL